MHEPYYLTTAIAYTSRKPHIGNTYEIVMTDTLARFRRMQGYDVYFLTGTDEHGQKIEEIAKEAGITPQEHVDRIAGEIRSICDLLNTSYNQFIRTTDEKHTKIVQDIFQRLYDQGDIYKGEYVGKYCTPCESFWTESQLKDGKCPDCGRDVRDAREEAYFLKLSKYQDWIEQYIEEHPDFIYPEARKKEMLNNFIKQGLQDLCVSRTTVKWGIPVPFDDKHVIYIWIDALSNYITALGYDVNGNHGELFKKYWPADVHIIGKDIVRFHTIYWTIMLHALGVPIPKKVFGHPWMLFGNDKMSKSRGNVIYADELVSRFGVDAVRYYLLAEMPFAQDGSITYESMIERFNSDLANTLGNLVNRTVAMVNQYFGGSIPSAELIDGAPEEACDAELKDMAEHAAEKMTGLLDSFRVSEALNTVMTLASRCNKYIDETTPWVLAKSEESRPRLAKVMYDLLSGIRVIGGLLKPYMPQTAEKILAHTPETDEIKAIECELDRYKVFGGVQYGASVGEAKPMFVRVNADALMKELAEAQKAAAEAAAAAEAPQAAPAPIAEQIGIETFAQSDIRAAKVLACEKVKKSNKLLCFRLFDGIGERQVVSGIAKWYSPEELVGKTLLVVANLKPVKLCGVESCGMICSVEQPDGSIKLVMLDDSIAAGSRLC
ncbi:MAG: methionine--tRNA ligase [Oscillospiraceae bacterium]|nr:methionine--tRNA ligase [Oscillospiraceae bacterium]